MVTTMVKKCSVCGQDLTDDDVFKEVRTYNWIICSECIDAHKASNEIKCYKCGNPIINGGKVFMNVGVCDRCIKSYLVR